VVLTLSHTRARKAATEGFSHHRLPTNGPTGRAKAAGPPSRSASAPCCGRRHFRLSCPISALSIAWFARLARVWRRIGAAERAGRTNRNCGGLSRALALLRAKKESGVMSQAVARIDTTLAGNLKARPRLVDESYVRATHDAANGSGASYQERRRRQPAAPRPARPCGVHRARARVGACLTFGFGRGEWRVPGGNLARIRDGAVDIDRRPPSAPPRLRLCCRQH